MWKGKGHHYPLSCSFHYMDAVRVKLHVSRSAPSSLADANEGRTGLCFWQGRHDPGPWLGSLTCLPYQLYRPLTGLRIPCYAMPCAQRSPVEISMEASNHPLQPLSTSSTLQASMTPLLNLTSQMGPPQSQLKPELLYLTRSREDPMRYMLLRARRLTITGITAR